MSRTKYAALWLLRLLLKTRYGMKAWDYFLWEETPFPVGQPSWSQIWWGYKWALRLPYTTIRSQYEDQDAL